MSDICSTIEEKLRNGKITLPSLPEITIKLREIAGNPNSTIKDLSDLICQDAGIAAQLIRLAQTMRYSHPGYSISSLNTAINRIGMQGTINLVMAMSILQGYTFHSKSIYSMCKEDNNQSRQICRYALTIYEICYGNLTQEKSDFIALASVFLNIGILPIYSELDIIERITKIQIDENFIKRIKIELRAKLGKKILEKWDFNNQFIATLDLSINENYTKEMKSIVYAYNYVTSTKKESLAPLEEDISESFCPLYESSYKSHLIEYIQENNINDQNN